ncbi:MAG TPA: GNAT family N-acetyltransferase [Bacteroidia bacterium]|nr:GNAT family N-acetyltransferase [Bacteroidia bacterium]
MEFVQIKYPDTQKLQQFIDEAGISLKSFRYFQKRPLEVIKNHACTFLLLDGEEPVAYGHLDKEDNTIWLGVAVIEAYLGLGLGALVMKKLIDFAKENYIPVIKLSVDNDNSSAISLYKKLGFVLQEKKEGFSFYSLSVL